VAGVASLLALFVSSHAAHRRPWQVLGIGSGSTVVFAVQRIAHRVAKESLKLVCIPTSYQALQLIREHKLVLGDLSTSPVIDLCIDGADEITPALACIKGGGGCHVQEKIVAYNSAVFVVVCDSSKFAEHLGEHWRRGVPIEIVPLATEPITRKLRAMGGDPKLRMAKSKMGPVVSDNGNFILDVDFGGLVGDKAPEKLDGAIRAIPGVVETGLFIGMANKVYLGCADGVRTIEVKKASL